MDGFLRVEHGREQRHHDEDREREDQVERREHRVRRRDRDAAEVLLRPRDDDRLRDDDEADIVEDEASLDELELVERVRHDSARARVRKRTVATVVVAFALLVVALVIGLPALRIRGPYLAVVTLAFALAMNREKPQFFQRNSQCVRNVIHRFPNRQTEAIELLFVVGQLPEHAVTRAHRAAEKSFSLRTRHYLFPFRDSESACRGFDFRQEPFVSERPTAMVFLQRTARNAHMLLDNVGTFQGFASGTG